jgi:diaminohydroxyphosphoribosylaminopyrimidine deaminase / 5-amino-6-(5-phosphoribosylamino)uracil reductase
MTKDESLIWRCIELARKGKGHVSPNPLVGCVIVKNGKIISEGYHKKYGALHAEADAIENAKSKGIEIKGATLYVNLEPCTHFGNTPPCADRIIEAGISKVVIGCADPYKLVNGKGIALLKKIGIKVITGVLEYECQELNKFFFKYVKTGLPYITLKAAQTIDSKIADEKFNSKWISSVESRTVVHRLRGEYDAVLVGKNTVKYDNPKLTVRLAKGRNPYRIVIDKELSLGLNYLLYSDRYKERTIIITSPKTDKKKAKTLTEKRIKLITAKITHGKIDLKDAMKKIAAMGIASILVEGGAFTFSGFLNQSLADELVIFTSPKIMGKGISTFGESKRIDFKNVKEIYYQFIGKDILTNIKF